ncbi:MAG TPA: hypothetical protein VNI77_09970 [Nitrososphaera sp.]|nr:hypothetical protein [Nitrososphaera sp.]
MTTVNKGNLRSLRRKYSEIEYAAGTAKINAAAKLTPAAIDRKAMENRDVYLISEELF